MACLDANVVADLVDQRLDAATRVDVEAHVAACGDCRALVGELVRGAGARTVELAPGAELGRYVIVRRIGAGGMGVVYAAHDNELERDVALKLLRADAVDPVAMHDRLLREARTMAKISHPGVVAIHDVGVADGRVFVAMELVAGVTLRDWMRGPRTTRQICDAFAQAGRGLAAVHAAGLVHGDFKPDNVLVRDDGRVQVTDFGLARLVAPEGADPLMSSAGGTPAYMAPEQAAGRCAAASDQFSFCASLYEALAGARAPAPLAAPRWLRRIIDRGLAHDQADRFATMDALVAELVRDRQRTARRLALAGAAVVIAAASVAAVVIPQRHRLAACASTGDQLAGVWDRTRSEAIHRAFLATGKPYADDEWRGVERVLTARAAAWTTLATAACEADARDAKPDELRDSCLADTRDELGAIAKRLEIADPLVVQHAVQAVELVRDASHCTGALPALPRDPGQRARALSVLGESVLLHVTDKISDADAAHILSELAALDYEPIHVLALVDVGTSEFNLGRIDDARARFDEALVRAERADDARGSLAAMLAQVGLTWATGDHASAQRWLARATAVGERIGAERDPFLAASLAQIRCGEVGLAGTAAAVVQACGAYVDATIRAEGPTSVAAAQAKLTAGLTMTIFGSKDGLDVVRNGIAVEEAALGASHPRIAQDLDTVAMGECEVGLFDACVSDAERAAQLVGQTQTGTEQHAIAEMVLANAYAKAKRWELGLAAAERAVAIEEALPVGTPDMQMTMILELVDQQLGLGRPEAALATLAKAEPSFRRILLPSSQSWAGFYSRLAAANKRLGRDHEAIAAYEQAIAVDPPPARAGHQLRLAGVLWRSGRDKTRALTLARQAATDPDASQADRDQATKWVAARAK